MTPEHPPIALLRNVPVRRIVQIFSFLVPSVGLPKYEDLLNGPLVNLGSAVGSAVRPGLGDAGADPLGDERAFKLGDRGDHREHGFAHRRGGIDLRGRCPSCGCARPARGGRGLDARAARRSPGDEPLGNGQAAVLGIGVQFPELHRRILVECGDPRINRGARLAEPGHEQSNSTLAIFPVSWLGEKWPKSS